MERVVTPQPPLAAMGRASSRIPTGPTSKRSAIRECGRHVCL
jgi:hypothetical protein